MQRSGVVRSLLAALLFGAAAPAASELAGSVPAFTLAGILYLGAALAVAPSSIRRAPSPAAIGADWRPTMLAVVVGGAVGPVLLMAGLARTSAATASILLNTELVATVVLAAVLFREHLGGRVVASAVVITVAGALLAWSPDAGLDPGAVLVVAACACWGLDNGVTARIEHLAPEHVVLAKGLVAGTANLVIGWSTEGLGRGTGVAEVAAALLIGALGYGASIVLWVRGARELGAARAQVIFATAPFVGAVVAWVALGDDVGGRQVAAVVIAAAGVALSLRSDHLHAHHHHAMEHEHEHEHGDGHHDHAHTDGFTGRHTHAHAHREVAHAHPHVPDLHHRHEH